MLDCDDYLFEGSAVVAGCVLLPRGLAQVAVLIEMLLATQARGRFDKLRWY